MALELLCLVPALLLLVCGAAHRGRCPMVGHRHPWLTDLILYGSIALAAWGIWSLAAR